MAPMPSVSHTCLLRSASSSRSGLASAGAAMAGSSRWIQHEGGAPAEQLAQPGRQRHAEQRGERETGHHQADGPCPLAWRGKPGRHQRSHAEVGAVRHAGDEAQRVEAGVARRGGAGEIAQREHQHQRHQQGAAPPAGGEHGEHRCTDHHAERVGADDVAGLRDGDADVGRHLGQQTHDDELTGADGEAAESQGEHGAAGVGGGDGGGRRDKLGGGGAGHGRRAGKSWATQVTWCGGVGAGQAALRLCARARARDGATVGETGCIGLVETLGSARPCAAPAGREAALPDAQDATSW
jgi:hypothetical protein